MSQYLSDLELTALQTLDRPVDPGMLKPVNIDNNLSVVIIVEIYEY